MEHNKRPILSVTFLTLALLLAISTGVAWSKGYSPNVHWTFCIDTSGSMKAKGQMDLLRLITERISNDFLNPKKNIIKLGDRVSIFSFDEGAKLEATALYQAENDLTTIKKKLKETIQIVLDISRFHFLIQLFKVFCEPSNISTFLCRSSNRICPQKARGNLDFLGVVPQPI